MWKVELDSHRLELVGDMLQRCAFSNVRNGKKLGASFRKPADIRQ